MRRVDVVRFCSSLRWSLLFAVSRRWLSFTASSREPKKDHRSPAIGLRDGLIESAFGPPDLRSDSSTTYYCTSCIAGDDPVEFVVEDSRIRRIRFNFYVD